MRLRARYPGWPIRPSSLLTTSCRGRHIRRSYVGSRGKKAVFDLLEGPFRGVFRLIIILCPTIRHNKTYHRRPWIWTDPEIFVLVPGERLHDHLRAFYWVFQGEPTLYIIEDCSATKALSRKKCMLSELAFSGRHAEQSILVLTQKFNSIKRNLASIYYSPRGYWKGLAAIKNHSAAAKISEDLARAWLKKQAIWQFDLPSPRHIPRSKFDIATPNEVQQADLSFLPLYRVGKRTYKCALTVVDVASRYKRLSPWLARLRQRSPMAWLGFTSGASCGGRSSFRLTLGASSWVR